VDPVAILVGLAVLCLLVLVPVFAIIVWIRLRELQRRVQQLEGRGRAVVPAPAAPIAPKPEPRPAPVVAPIVVPRPPELPPPLPIATPLPRPRIEWERWLGVRGAAVLGGVFLSIAGVLFFQYSVQQNWITVERRVLLGVIAGVAAMLGGPLARRRGYEFAGNALTGAGAVILYAAFWGAHKFGVLPALVCFAAMALVTAISCWLSYRTGSQLIAWLGLTGGFATPLLVSTGADRPIGLFAYVLVLDLGFLFVAGRKRWPLLGLWGLAGTVLIQALWVVKRMGPHELPIALVALAVFALLFVGASALASKSERGRWVISQISAVLVPFLFALYFAGQDDIGYHLWPLALLGALLSGASIWLARVQGAALVPAGAAAGASAITLVWVLARELDAARAWELCLCALVLLGVFALGREWRRSRLADAAAHGLEDAWLVACAGLALVGFVACPRSSLVEPWPFVVLFAALAIALVRVASSRRLAWVSCAAAPLALFGILCWTGTHEQVLPTLDPRTLEMLAAVLLAVVFAALAWFGRAGARAGFLGIALGAWVGCLLSLVLTGASTAPDGLGARLSLLFFAAIGCFGATAAGSWICVLLSALVCAAGQASVGVWNGTLGKTWNDELTAALVSIAVLGAWLPLCKRRWSASRGAWIAAALIPLLWLLDVGNSIGELQGSNGNMWIALPFALAELAIGAWLLRGAEAASTLARGALWPLLAAIVCASAIPPLWVDRGVVVVWSALASAGAAWFARRKSFVPAIVVATAGALVCAFAGVIVDGSGSFERLERVLLDAHAWEYLVPALALLVAGSFAANIPRIVCVVAGLLVGLLWITVEVHQAFAEGVRFELFWPRDEAREVVVSVVWAVYALLLLALGMRRKQSGLRWASLVLLVIVIGKLFLFDLGELQGLYRVASFLGLAVSLLLVSFGYQRFVFRKTSAISP
jgi:uncharacterized membrane protein